MPLGEGVQDEVFDPDAGMEEFRLMASDEELRFGLTKTGFAGRGEVPSRWRRATSRSGRRLDGGEVAENR